VSATTMTMSLCSMRLHFAPSSAASISRRLMKQTYALLRLWSRSVMWPCCMFVEQYVLRGHIEDLEWDPSCRTLRLAAHEYDPSMKMWSPSSGDGYDRLAMAAIKLYGNGIHRVVAVGGVHP
jgi:hypothetical protein